ncbi:MAG: ABC transporter permease [Acidobacteria bacterium]|nr:ABC transporter permease [Acidobacteriota bacterium]
MRFFLSAALIAGMCLIYTLLESRLYPGGPRVHNYTQYVHWTVFGGATRGVFQLTCLLLGLGGLRRDRKQGTLGFTLALPVSRASLVLSRAGVGLLQIVALSLIPAFAVTAGSYIVHQQLSLAYGIRFAPLWAAGGVFTFGISFLASVLFASEYVSLAVAYVVYIFYLAGSRLPRLQPYHLHVADFMSGLLPNYLNRSTMLWGPVYAIAPIVWFTAAALALVAVGMLATARQDL